MKDSLLTAALLAIAAVLGTLPAGNAYGQFAPRGGHTEIPDSSIEQPQHIGVRAHTNYKMFMPAAGEMAKALPLQARQRSARLSCDGVDGSSGRIRPTKPVRADWRVEP